MSDERSELVWYRSEVEKLRTERDNLLDAVPLKHDTVDNLIQKNQELRAENKRLRQAIKESVTILNGYNTGEYGEQGDFYPLPMRKTMAKLNKALEADQP